VLVDPLALPGLAKALGESPNLLLLLGQAKASRGRTEIAITVGPDELKRCVTIGRHAAILSVRRTFVSSPVSLSPAALSIWRPSGRAAKLAGQMKTSQVRRRVSEISTRCRALRSSISFS